MNNHLNEITKVKDLSNPWDSPNRTVNDTSVSDPKESKMSPESLANTTNSSNQLPSFHCAQCSYHSIWKHAVERHQLKHEKKDQNVAETNIFCCNEDNQNELKAHLRVYDQSFQNKELQEKHVPKSKVTRKPQSNIKSKDSSKNQSNDKNTKRPYQRGKYANVPVKTTKDGFFQCEYCTYQTVIRSALVIHQIRHEKKESC